MKNFKLLLIISFLFYFIPKSNACHDPLAGCEGCTGDISFAFTSFERVPNWDEEACLFPDPSFDEWGTFCDFADQTVNGAALISSTDLDEVDYTSFSGNHSYWIRAYTQNIESCWDENTLNDYQNGTGDCYFLIEDINELNCAWTMTVEMMSQCTNDECTGEENTGIQWKSSFDVGAGEFNCFGIALFGFQSTIELDSATVPCNPNTNYGC